MSEIKGIDGVFKFFGEAGVFWLATEDGAQPKVRPISFQMLLDGKIYFGVGRHKDVFHQMEKNPLVEICAYKDMDIVRYYGKAVVEPENPELFAKAAEVLPLLNQIYNEKTGLKLALFYIEDGKAEYSNLVDYSLKHAIEL